MEELLNKMIGAIRQTRELSPLIHCLTNALTANDCANILLTVGARPIMAHHPKEIEEITSKAKALVINIGGITDDKIAALYLAGKVAKEAGIPIIFDPVGAAGNTFRKALSKEILAQLSPTIIKGNMSEIKALSDIETDAVGVDASPLDEVTDENTPKFCEIAKKLAVKQNAVVVATGKIDIVANQSAVYLIQNGTSMLSKITGTGCMCSSLTGAYCHTGDYLTAAITATTLMGIAGELASEACNGIGSFKTLLFDYLYTLSEKTLRERSVIIEHH